MRQHYSISTIYLKTISEFSPAHLNRQRRPTDVFSTTLKWKTKLRIASDSDLLRQTRKRRFESGRRLLQLPAVYDTHMRSMSAALITRQRWAAQRTMFCSRSAIITICECAPVSPAARPSQKTGTYLQLFLTAYRHQRQEGLAVFLRPAATLIFSKFVTQDGCI